MPPIRPVRSSPLLRPLLALAVALVAGPVAAQEEDPGPDDPVRPDPEACTLLDFETIPGVTVSEGLVIDTQLEASLGMTFALEDGTSPRLAEVGRPQTAFVGRGPDGPAPGQGVGAFFLTDDGVLRGRMSSPLIVTFSMPVDSASGVVLDIDYTERFTIEVRDDAGEVLESLTISAGDPGTGDGIATPWGFGRDSADVASIRFEGTRRGGRFGLGFDNFVTCAPARVERPSTEGAEGPV